MSKRIFILAALATLGACASRPAKDATRLDPPRYSHAQAMAAIQRSQVASPYKLSAQARAGEIRYVLEGPDWSWPQTAEQTVTVDGARTRITVCSDCGSESRPDAAVLAHYRQANAWVDSDNHAVIVFAGAHTFGTQSREPSPQRVDRQMRALVKAVQEHMGGPIDFKAYDSASSALRQRSGDCTEFALLLAAAARARGIPARLVFGMAYASRFTGQSHVFSPHVWVQAWDGERWRSYDAGLGEFDAGHIALAIGDGNPRLFEAAARALSGMRIVDAVGVTRVKAVSAPSN